MTTETPGSKSTLRWLWLAAAVVVVDQLTKALIVSRFQLYEVMDVLPVLEITRLQNTGAAFSMLAGASGWQRWFFVVLAVGISSGLTYWLRRLPRDSSWFMPVALTLVMGGALGNAVDRVRLGHVIDFLYFHWGDAYFPAFNVADSCITVGACLLVLDAILDSRRARRAAGPS